MYGNCIPEYHWSRSHLDIEVQILIRDLGVQILALNETKLDPKLPKELTIVAGCFDERLGRTCYGGSRLTTSVPVSTAFIKLDATTA